MIHELDIPASESGHTLALAHEILMMWFSIKDNLLISLETRVFWRSFGSVDYRTQASNETHTGDMTLEQKKGMLQALMGLASRTG